MQKNILKFIPNKFIFQYISQLASCSNSAVVGGAASNQTSQDQSDRDAQAKMHYYLALQGLKLLR